MTIDPNLAAIVAAQNQERIAGSSAVLPETAEPVGFGQGSVVTSTTNAVVGWQSGSTTLPTNASDSGQALFNAVYLNGSHAPGAYQFSVDPAGLVSITDTSSGGATSGQTMTVQGASYLLFDGAANPIFIAGGTSAEIARLYDSAFGRIPDLAGFEAWNQAVSSGGVSLQQAARLFLQSNEFTGRHGSAGSLSDIQYVTDMYSDVLGRAPDTAGLTAWTKYLTGLEAQSGNAVDGNLTARAVVLQGFATSQEEIQHTAPWLIDKTTGGYVDPGKIMDAQTGLNQGEANNYINTALMKALPTFTNIHSANTTYFGSSDVMSSGWNLQSYGLNKEELFGTNVNNSTVIESNVVDTVYLNGNNNTVYGSQTNSYIIFLSLTGTAVIGAGPMTIQGPSLDSPGANAPTPASIVVVNFNPSKDVFETESSVGGGVRILDATQGQTFNGAALSFRGGPYGGWQSQPAQLLKLGDVGGGSPTEVAATVNKAYALADTPSEHLIIVGQVTQNSAVASAGDTVLYEYLRVSSDPMSNGFINADLNNNHLVDGNELTFEAKFVGLSTSSITAHSFSG